ncbi:MAG: S-adenosylmethionine decarboxylase [Candidatus Bilamarchaeaceae archaeon]
MGKLMHLHLAVNAKIGPDFKELSREKAQEFVNELMRITDMKPLGPLNWSNAVDLDFPGQSFVQMITTSHCSVHYFSETREIYFDLYSCKKFNPNEVIELLDKFFGLEEWHGMLYHRAQDEKPKIKKLQSKMKAKALN